MDELDCANGIAAGNQILRSGSHFDGCDARKAMQRHHCVVPAGGERRRSKSKTCSPGIRTHDIDMRRCVLMHVMDVSIRTVAMPARSAQSALILVHVVTTRRTYKGRVYEMYLLRRSYRDGDRVKNETLGNLSHLPAAVIDLAPCAAR